MNCSEIPGSCFNGTVLSAWPRCVPPRINAPPITPAQHLYRYAHNGSAMAPTAGLEPTRRESKSRVLPLHYVGMLITLFAVLITLKDKSDRRAYLSTPGRACALPVLLFVCSQRFRCKPCVILRGCQADSMQPLQCCIHGGGVFLHYGLPE